MLHYPKLRKREAASLLEQATKAVLRKQDSFRFRVKEGALFPKGFPVRRKIEVLGEFIVLRTRCDRMIDYLHKEGFSAYTYKDLVSQIASFDMMTLGMMNTVNLQNMVAVKDRADYALE